MTTIRAEVRQPAVAMVCSAKEYADLLGQLRMTQQLLAEGESRLALDSLNTFLERYPTHGPIQAPR